MPGDLSIPTKILLVLVAAASSLFCWWTTWVLLQGGAIPILGWEVDGSLGVAVAFLMFGWPIISTVAFWLGILLMLPLEAIFAKSPQ